MRRFFSALVLLSAVYSQVARAEYDFDEALRFYANAMHDRDTYELKNITSKKVFEFYGQLKRKALSGSWDEISNSSTFERWYVYLIRHEFSAEQLNAMSGRDLYLHFIANHGINIKRLVGMPRDAFVINGDTAVAKLRTGSIPGEHALRFMHESGHWYFDLTSLNSLLSWVFDNMFSGVNGVDSHDKMVALAESHTGNPIGARIYLPMQ